MTDVDNDCFMEYKFPNWNGPWSFQVRHPRILRKPRG
jgi:hypothetical protein